jgi:hypothetical protein
MSVDRRRGYQGRRDVVRGAVGPIEGIEIAGRQRRATPVVISPPFTEGMARPNLPAKEDLGISRDPVRVALAGKQHVTLSQLKQLTPRKLDRDADGRQFASFDVWKPRATPAARAAPDGVTADRAG